MEPLVCLQKQNVQRDMNIMDRLEQTNMHVLKLYTPVQQILNILCQVINVCAILKLIPVQAAMQHLYPVQQRMDLHYLNIRTIPVVINVNAIIKDRLTVNAQTVQQKDIHKPRQADMFVQKLVR